MFCKSNACLFLITALYVFSPSAFALEPRFSVELHAGQSTLEPTSTFDTDTGAVPIGSDEDTSYAVRMRYFFNDFFAVEAGYNDYGEGQSISTNPDPAVGDIENTYSSSSIELGIQATVDMGSNIEFVARIGMALWDYDFTARRLNNNSTTKINDSGNDLFIGAGLQYRMLEDFYFGLSLTGVTVETKVGSSEVGNDLQATTLHVGYDF